MGFESECVQLRTKGVRLSTLVKTYQKYSSLLDEQVLLAGIINILVKNNFKVSKSEIYYCFKKNYNRDFHGDVQFYVTWLYSLAQASRKNPNNSITEPKARPNLNENESLGEIPLKPYFNQNNTKDMINMREVKNNVI